MTAATRHADKDAAPDLYNGDGSPWWNGSPPLDGPSGVALTHPACLLIYNHVRGTNTPESVDYIWAVQADLAKIGLPDEALAQLVYSLDNGGVIAVHGATPDHAARGFDLLMLLVGGGRA